MRVSLPARLPIINELRMNISFDAAVVLITGASKGIGFACAQAFAQAGATVVGVSRSQANLDAARANLQKQGLDMRTFAADLSDATAAEQVVARIESEVGPIAALVNSAGAAKRYALSELDAQAFRQAMDAKYFSYMHVLDPVAKRMAGRGRGSIVNIIGHGGKNASSIHIAGGSANAALMLSTAGYAQAYAAQGVRVNALNPGLTQTERVQEGVEAAARNSGRDAAAVLADFVAGIPMGRFAKPEEIANVALFLSSDFASYVSGAIIPMDGCVSAII